MHEQAVDEALAEEALAHALWPGWAYFNQRYRIPDTQPGQQTTQSEPEAIAAT
jgi:hypothetical protein